MLSADLKQGLWNLHDAFLNASIVRQRMLRFPFEPNPQLFHATDRAPLERLWVALLAVLIECWHASATRPVRDYVGSVTSTDQLIALLRQSRKDGRHGKMVECRHYMFHRDKRQYWDDGRSAPIGELEFHLKLHQAFSDVLLAAVRAANAASGAGPTSALPNPRLRRTGPGTSRRVLAAEP